MKIKILNISSLAFILAQLMGCAKENSSPSDKVSEVSSKTAYQQILDDRERNSTKPVTDPSACNDNPQGFLYLKIGDELLRTTKDSSIYIDSVKPDHMREHKKLDTSIPEGCEGNPYVYPDAFIEIRHKPNDPTWQKVKFDGFLITFHDPLDVNYKNLAQKYDEAEFYAFKKDDTKVCNKLPNGLERCGWRNEDGSVAWPRIYKSDNYTVSGHPFVLNCGPSVGGAKCQTTYRLYPGVYLNYGFMPTENKNWDEEQIILFDQYIRNLFESIRVKK